MRESERQQTRFSGAFAQIFKLEPNLSPESAKFKSNSQRHLDEVESIRRWWQQWGKVLYPEKRDLLITADGGGSNGVRNRLWKKKLQELATEEQIAITVVHYPPATSKWNKIEHRLFSFISVNWRAKPLVSLETIIELISHTTTREGLVVTAVKDSNTYPTGIKVSDEELEALHIIRDDFHGEWNYILQPSEVHVI